MFPVLVLLPYETLASAWYSNLLWSMSSNDSRYGDKGLFGELNGFFAANSKLSLLFDVREFFSAENAPRLTLSPSAVRN